MCARLTGTIYDIPRVSSNKEGTIRSQRTQTYSKDPRTRELELRGGKRDAKPVALGPARWEPRVVWLSLVHVHGAAQPARGITGWRLYMHTAAPPPLTFH
jgi:hypothetical protein